jgi:hypothetical protein
MTGPLRVVCTVILLTIVWTFRRTRGAVFLGFLAGIWLRRLWITGPARTGALGTGGGEGGTPPRWVRIASGPVTSGRAIGGRRSLFKAPPAKQVTRWW